jgi:predicted nucleotidyltransferase
MTAIERSQALLERARAIAAPYREQAGVIGAFVFGSAARPYADEWSDVDVQVVVEDAAIASITEPHYVREVAGRARGSDVWLIGMRNLERLLAIRADNHRRRVADAVVLFDTNDAVASLVARAAHIPPELREARMRVHHYEVAYAAQRLHKAERRGRGAVARLFGAELVIAAGKLLFFARGQWPGALPWMFEELAAAGVPDDIVAAMRALAASPSARAARGLRGKIDAYLLANDVRFVADLEALGTWINHTPEGQHAHLTYGGELSRRA